MITLLLILCGVATIISLWMVLYGTFRGKSEPTVIGGIMAFVTLLFLLMLGLMM